MRADLVPVRRAVRRAGCSRTGRRTTTLLDPINRVFLPRADIATETLVAGLTELGWEVDDVTAYRTVRAAPPPAPTREAIKTGKFDAVVFTSSSTVRNLVGIAGKPHASTVIAVIGPATAKTAEEHGLRVDVMAPSPSVEELADALADFGADRRAAAGGGRPAGHRVRPSGARRPVAGRPEPMAFPSTRPRRLRRTPAMRRLVAETTFEPRQLVLPMFVREGADEPTPISSMPGVVQHTRDTLRKAAAEAAELGLGGIMLFGVPDAARTPPAPARSTPTASSTSRSRDVRRRGRRRAAGDVGPVPRRVHRPRALRRARRRRRASTTTPRWRCTPRWRSPRPPPGSHVVGPSGMMDGQVGAIRAALDAAGHQDVAILAYSAKYASAFFGPFREAVDSSLQGDRRTYQQDPAQRRRGVREALLDIAEGADMVMVKPALAYLDVIRAVRDDGRRAGRGVQHLRRVRDGRGRRRQRLDRPRPRRSWRR